MIEIGDEFYDAFLDMIDGAVIVELWVITAIRNDLVFACRKNAFTWIKRSSKTGDYGWARNLDAFDRVKFRHGDLPQTWAKSKAAAYTKALPQVDVAIARLTKLRAQITGQRTRARKRPLPGRSRRA